MLQKQNSPSLSRNLSLGTFGELLIVFSTKLNLPYLLYSTARKCCLLHLSFNLNDSAISLSVFLSRTNVKPHKILDAEKGHKEPWSGSDCIPVVVLKNCESELSYILAELFNMCLKESCFLDSWKASSVVLVFKNVCERSTAKNYRPVSLLSMVSKVFEKLVNKRIVHHLE